MGANSAAVGKGALGASGRARRNAVAYLYARDFRAVALKAGSPLVRAYLLGHSLELYLKAYLLTRGFSERVLRTRRLRHDLSALLNEAESRGLGDHLRISLELRRDLRSLNDPYARAALEYVSWWNLLAPPSVPDSRRLSRFAANLDTLVRRLVADAV